MNRQLSILFTNTWLLDRAGTELVISELAAGLLAAGHYPMGYSPRLGRIADDLRACDIPVTDDLDCLPRKPDIIHGHHHVEAMQALLHFLQACGIYVCHDRTAWQDTPPLVSRILRYVAAGLSCRERILIAGPITDDRKLSLIIGCSWIVSRAARICLPNQSAPLFTATMPNPAGMLNPFGRPAMRAVSLWM